MRVDPRGSLDSWNKKRRKDEGTEDGFMVDRKRFFPFASGNCRRPKYQSAHMSLIFFLLNFSSGKTSNCNCSYCIQSSLASFVCDEVSVNHKFNMADPCQPGYGSFGVGHRECNMAFRFNGVRNCPVLRSLTTSG